MSTHRIVWVLPFVLFACLCQAQGHQPPNPSQDHQIPTIPETDDETQQRINSALAKKWNKERQAAILRDTDKLLALAQELKAGVEKSNENILAVDVVRKAEEIEKLAHSVKEKMKAN